MFIKEIKLVFSDNNRLIRRIEFHTGVNFVIDTESSEMHNKVGKTTLLRLIDIALGAQEKKNLYFDAETNNVELDLKARIEEDKLAVILILANSFGESFESVECKVDLFNRGKRYIDGESLPLKDYRRRLNDILFQNEVDIPTFRQAISPFMRISLRGDDSSFLKTLPNASTAVYRSLYNFLFDISDPLDDKKLGDLKHELNRVKESEKQYKSLQNAKEISEQKQVLNALMRERESVNSKLNDIVDERYFVENREKINSAREQYSELEFELSNVDFRIDRIDKAILDIRDEASRGVNRDLSKAFFDEVRELIPEIDKTFEEMIQFNQALNENQRKYFTSIKDQLLVERETIKEKQVAIVEANDNYVSLVENNQIDEYEELQDRLLSIQKRIDSVESVIETLEKYEKQKQQLKEAISEIEGNSLSLTSPIYDKRMEQFNQFFTAIANDINGEEPVLVYYPNTKDFPVGIDALYGTSTGTRKSLIAAYDISYQRFAQVIKKHVPRFVIHDVVESIEGESLEEMVRQEQDSGSQYIIAVLKEKLDSSGLSQEEQDGFQVVQLSLNNRLFDYERGLAKEEVVVNAKDVAEIEKDAFSIHEQNDWSLRVTA